ncbi:MAG: hypothetical protein JO326_05060, partial [Acetobacteraceae bacterium]|nr:hypothetical protein [Acetobacteraceae bacterium]
MPPNLDAAQELMRRIRACADGTEDPHYVVAMLLQAFPEKQRLLSVHIPKCAGSHLRETARLHLPLVEPNLGDPRWTTESRLHNALYTLLAKIADADAILAHGHVPLRWYLARELKRPGGRLFAVVREPVALLLSWADYVVTVLVSDPELRRPDTRLWRRELALGDEPVPAHPAERLALADRILCNSAIPVPNTLCSYLGDGDADSARELVAASGIELADFAHYGAWFDRTFGIPEGGRTDPSTPFLAGRSLTRRQRARVLEISEQDRVLYT